MSRNLSLSIITQFRDRLSEPLKKVSKGTVSAVGALNKMKDELDSLNKSQTQLASHKRLAESLDKTKQSLMQAQIEAAEYAKSLKATINPSQAARNSLESKKRTVENLNQKVSDQTKRLSESSNKLKDLGVNTKDLASEESRLANSIRQTTSQFEKQKLEVDKVSKAHKQLREQKDKLQKRQSLASSMSVTGAVGYTAGTRALRGIGGIIAPGLSFDKTMSRVQSLSRLDKDDEGLIALRNQAKELGATTMFTATQVAEAQAFLAMAGIEAQNIKKALPGLLNLSAADDLDIGRAADIVSNVLEAMQIPADQMERVSDSMVAAFTRSNVSVEMIGETMKYVAGAGNQLGIDLETLLAATGLMGNAGVQAGQAGTALRSIMLRLAAPEKMAQDALDSLKINQKDSDGNLRNFIELLDEINEKTSHMGNAERAGIIKSIAGTEAVTAMMQLLNNTDKSLGKSGASNFTEFLDQIKNSQGEAAKVAKTMTDNLAGDLTAVASAWEGIGIGLFETQNGPLRQLAQQLAAILVRINKWIEANPELTGRIAKVVIALAALVAAGGALLMIVGSILGPIALLQYTFGTFFIKLTSGIGIIGKLSTVLKIFPIIIKALGRAFLMNPLGLFIAAIYATVVAIRNWDKIKEYLNAFWSWISAKFTELGPSILSSLKSGFKSVLTFFDNYGVLIQEKIWNWSPIGVLYTIFAKVLSFFNVELPADLHSALIALNNVFKAFNPLSILITIFDDIGNFFSGLTNRFIDYGKNLASGLAKGIKSGISSAVDAIGNLGNSVVSRTRNFFKMNSPSRLFAEIGHGLPEGLAVGIKRNTELAKRAATTMAIATTAAAGNMATAAESAPIRFDTRPSIMSMAASQRTAPTIAPPAQEITINVYAAPGQSTESIAQQVREELERIRFDDAARRRSSYTDYGN